MPNDPEKSHDESTPIVSAQSVCWNGHTVEINKLRERFINLVAQQMIQELQGPTNEADDQI